MSTAAPLQNAAVKPQQSSHLGHGGLLLQRKCACGSPTSSLTGECKGCKSKTGLQAKLTIGASNDPLEREADRVADQVMAAPAHSVVSGAPPHIQRYAGQATEGTDTAPASVDRVLASPGRPLEPTLRQDMEQRFGHDFSRVLVHSGGTAEQSARDVDANAYAVGHNIVFGAGRFAPGTPEGRRLIAHELTHVVQQSGSDGIRVDRHPVLRRQSVTTRSPSTPQKIKEVNFGQLAMLPHLALKQWKLLSKGERDQVLQQMTARYGGPFTSEFQKYANGVKKPKPGLGWVLKGPEYTPKWLFERGYRHAYGEIWVHPSGEYLMVLPPTQTKPEPEPEPKPDPEPEPPPHDLAKCADPCMNKTENEEDCDQCCKDTIPAEEKKCLWECDAACDTKETK